MTGERSGDVPEALKDRINRLVATIHPADRGPYTDEEIVNGIREAGGPSMSVAYFNHLRRGRRTNPTMATIEGIVRFFRVPVGNLFADEYAETTEEDRRILTLVRQAELETLLEMASELPEETRASLARIIEDLHRLHAKHRRPPRR
ncbi:hypothetical protein [Pseudonocardia parietis]|uniref:Transcriptional regulator with XRE-family HTH domain n=1 Tax=Pseudonocardia parietis TaxID=570936 RepID=A0ABS4W6X7_9PSEU|nr:hypothetical protein [Pseudonocardia parietis]MBP2371967.1 transcriptional regulator with XRE-family HTH domain [Pseudonocardia parietis]